MKKTSFLVLCIILLAGPVKAEGLNYSFNEPIKGWENDLLNTYRILKNESSAKVLTVDGLVDAYEDQSGINTSASTNETYDSTNDLYAPVITASTVKLLLHFDGEDEQVWTLDSSIQDHYISLIDEGFLDTGSKVFGSSSFILNGVAAHASLPDSTDWDIIANNSDDWTLDFWIRLNDPDSADFYYIVGQNEPTANPTADMWYVRYNYGGGGFNFLAQQSDSPIINSGFGGELSDTDWHHVAFIIDATGSTKNIGLYVDGTQVAYTQDNSTDSLTARLNIGARSDVFGNTVVDGHIDELRLDRSNTFGAAPNVSVNNTITVPTAPSEILNMVLVSGTFSAEAQPDRAGIVLFEEDVNAVTLNEDIQAYVSRDGGATYSEITLEDQGAYDSGKRILSGIGNISDQPAGSTMTYKLKTLRDKDLKLHGVGLIW